jgi:hypothetical protein
MSLGHADEGASVCVSGSLCIGAGAGVFVCVYGYISICRKVAENAVRQVEKLRSESTKQDRSRRRRREIEGGRERTHNFKSTPVAILLSWTVVRQRGSCWELNECEKSQLRMDSGAHPRRQRTAMSKLPDAGAFEHAVQRGKKERGEEESRAWRRRGIQEFVRREWKSALADCDSTKGNAKKAGRTLALAATTTANSGPCSASVQSALRRRTTRTAGQIQSSAVL